MYEVNVLSMDPAKPAEINWTYETLADAKAMYDIQVAAHAKETYEADIGLHDLEKGLTLVSVKG